MKFTNKIIKYELSHVRTDFSPLIFNGVILKKKREQVAGGAAILLIPPLTSCGDAR